MTKGGIAPSTACKRGFRYFRASPHWLAHTWPGPNLYSWLKFSSLKSQTSQIICSHLKSPSFPTPNLASISTAPPKICESFQWWLAISWAFFSPSIQALLAAYNDAEASLLLKAQSSLCFLTSPLSLTLFYSVPGSMTRSSSSVYSWIP